jgi:hypothetical protein
VQTRSNLAFFYIAEKAANRIERPRATRQVVAPTRVLQRLHDLSLKLGRAARIKAQTVSMLFQQALHLFQVTVQSGSGQRRSQVIDNDGSGSPLGLRAFSRVVDNERIKMRQWPKTKPRIIIPAKRNTSAGQPFQISMLTEVHNRVRAECFANPEIKSEIFGGRR